MLNFCLYDRFHIQLDATAVSETYLASCETLRALPAPEGPYTGYDLSIIHEILQLAAATVQQEYAAGKGSNVVTLVKVLQAYDVVLPHHGVVPSEDVHYYRALLQLSLDPNPDWFGKFQQLHVQQHRYERTLGAMAIECVVCIGLVCSVELVQCGSAYLTHYLTQQCMRAHSTLSVQTSWPVQKAKEQQGVKSSSRTCIGRCPGP